MKVYQNIPWEYKFRNFISVLGFYIFYCQIKTTMAMFHIRYKTVITPLLNKGLLCNLGDANKIIITYH